jgi:hypothetical protein
VKQNFDLGLKPSRFFALPLALFVAGSPQIALAQQQGADDIRRTYGMTPDVEASNYRTPSRDVYGTRLIVNGRAIDLGGSRSAGPARLADPSTGFVNQGGFRSGRLPQSTLRPSVSATSIANNVFINNTSNSVISIWQVNTGRVSASVTAPR